MRKAIVGAMGVLVLVVAAGIPGAGAATKRSFTQDWLGAQISSSGLKGIDAYRVKDSVYGAGAGVQNNVVTTTTFPLDGSDTTTTYFATGSMKTKDTFKLGAIDADGISQITGGGHCTTGTGALEGTKCTYTFSGTLDTKTTRVHVTVKGTYSK